jgi:hypothetical protein
MRLQKAMKKPSANGQTMYSHHDQVTLWLVGFFGSLSASVPGLEQGRKKLPDEHQGPSTCSEVCPQKCKGAWEVGSWHDPQFVLMREHQPHEYWHEPSQVRDHPLSNYLPGVVAVVWE